MSGEQRGESRALFRAHPRRLDIPLLLAGCGVALWLGLREPVITVDRLIFGKLPYTVWGGVKGLWDDQDRALAVVVFLFSFVTPIAKLALLGWLWFLPTGPALRRRVLEALEAVGRWSMLDVFAVAILIVANKMSVAAERGIYWFCAAILASMVLTTLVRRAAATA
ncbi:MAG: paraquat-inducible protein A [Planctomycetes bacterium]|nr:paraquat-inducible protein A [Planctomycetota bacterium]